MLRLLSMLAAALCCWSAVAGTSADGEKLRLRLWNIPVKGANDPAGKAERAVFDLFLKTHPEIEVEQMVPLKIEGNASEGNEFMAVAGGMAPDVFYLFGRKVGNYIDQGFLAPLNERFKRDFADKGRSYEGVNAPDKIWELVVRGNDIHAVPMGFYGMTLAYRKDLFLKSGLDPTRPPETWDEMWEMGKRLTYLPSKEPDAPPDTMATYGMYLLNGQAHGGFYFLQFVWASGGQVVQSYRKSQASGELVPTPPPYFPYQDRGIKLWNAKQYEAGRASREIKGVDGPETWRLVTDSPEGVAALEFYRKLATRKWMRSYADDGKVASCFDITPEMESSGAAVCPVTGKRFDLSDPAVQSRIYKGIAKVRAQSDSQNERYQIAMSILTISDVTTIDWSQSAVTVFPHREGCKPKSFIAGHYLGVNATSSAERQEAAWRYIMFMTSEDAMRMRVKAFVENGLAQCVRPSLLRKYDYMDYYRELPESWIKLYEDVADSAEVEPYCKGFAFVMTTGLAKPIDMALLYPDMPCQKLMDDTCAEVNTKILSKRPEAEMRRYCAIAYVVLAAVLILVALGLAYIVRAKSREIGKTPFTGYIPGLSARRKRVYAISFMAVALVSVAAWQYYPLLRGSIMAVQDFKILKGGSYVGPRNFVDIFLDPNFYQYLWQTFYYVLLSMTLGFFAPLALAVLLTEVPKGKVIFRTLFYLPAVTTGLVTMFLWRELLYDPSPEGILNKLFSLFGIAEQSFLQDPSLAMLWVIIPGIWGGAGAGSLIYLAAFKCVPEEQYEAADLDGAGVLSKFRHVLLPNIKALVLINFLGSFIGSFHAAQNIFVMTGGGPVNKTTTVGLDIWYNSFLYLNFGYATAEAWVMGALLIGLTVMQLRVLGKVEFKTAGRAT